LAVALELLLVELHVVNDLAAVVESPVHSPLSCVGMHVGIDVLLGDRSRLVHFVLKPPSDLYILLAFVSSAGKSGSIWKIKFHFRL
jgi:hypothetical protein